jgi:DNA-binding Lrp family transcriptional regulator
MYKIDKIDIEIANLLVGNGRMSSAEIARHVGGISERSARYRLDRMIQEGLIEVSAIAKPHAIGLTVIADVWIQVETERIQEVAMKMAEYDCVSYVAYAIGERDVSVQVVGHNTGEIYQFITEVIGKTPGVIKTSTSIVPKVVKDVYQWRFPASGCLEDKAQE